MLKLQYFGHQQTNHRKSPWCWKRSRAEEEGVRGWESSPLDRKELDTAGWLNNHHSRYCVLASGRARRTSLGFGVFPGSSFFLATPWACGILVPPSRDWTHTPLQWKPGILTTGLPGKSLGYFWTHSDWFFQINLRMILPDFHRNFD